MPEQTAAPMGNVRINLAGVSTELEPIPTGTYPVQLTEVRGQMTRQTNEPMIVWLFKIADGQQAGRMVFHNTVLTPKSIWNYKRTIKALGAPQALLESPDLDALEVAQEYVGAEAVVVIVPSVYEGKASSKMAQILPAGSKAEEVAATLAGNAIEAMNTGTGF